MTPQAFRQFAGKRWKKACTPHHTQALTLHRLETGAPLLAFAYNQVQEQKRAEAASTFFMIENRKFL